MSKDASPLAKAARYGQTFRDRPHPLHPTETAAQLRERFCTPLPKQGLPEGEVLDALIDAAEPGLVGNTDPNFFAWVMGGSDPLGVAADWLTSVWGQNAGIYQTSPAAAIAEEAVEAWLLELLDLPRESSVGLVTGATMAAFTALAAARTEVLARAGHDFEADGLQGAPLVRVFMSDEAHVTNKTALRHLGFGASSIVHLPSDEAGLMDPYYLAKAMERHSGPKIVVAQAGQINSGGFEGFAEICRIAQGHNAWVHVDGAFGLWARAASETRAQTHGVEMADSWSVDGHKWLQIPYDSGFAIVRHADAHRRAMSITANYLNEDPEDGRSPTSYAPGLSRRARGFAAWAILQGLGRDGVAEIVSRHCAIARHLGARINGIEGLEVLNKIGLNQVLVGASEEPERIIALADHLNAHAGVFVKTAAWKGRPVLRLSVISRETEIAHADHLADAIAASWRIVRDQ